MGLASPLIGGVVALASGVAITLYQGRVQEAQPFLEELLRYWGVPDDTLSTRVRVVVYGPGRGRQWGPLERARQLVREARDDPVPGVPTVVPCRALLDRVERGLNVRVKGTLRDGDMPTEAEVRVLRLLAGPLPQSGIPLPRSSSSRRTR